MVQHEHVGSIFSLNPTLANLASYVLCITRLKTLTGSYKGIKKSFNTNFANQNVYSFKLMSIINH